MNKDQREIQRKLRILRYADEIGHVTKACRYFGIARASFYRWRTAHQKHGEKRAAVFHSEAPSSSATFGNNPCIAMQ